MNFGKETLLVIAPHPDDETLGCGGAILKHIDEGHKVDWLIATTNKSSPNITNEEIIKREKEIEGVSSSYSFAGVHNLELPTTLLDSIPKHSQLKPAFFNFSKNRSLTVSTLA